MTQLRRWLLYAVLLALGCRERDVPHHFAILLDTSAQLGPEWVELPTTDSLLADRDNNCLVTTLAAGYRPTQWRTEYVDSTGRDTVAFEAYLVLTDGQRHVLTGGGTRTGPEPTAILCDAGPRPDERRWFRAVYIRALHPVSIRRIEWQSYDVSL